MNNSADIRASRALVAALHTHTLKHTHRDISLKMMMYNKGSGRRKKRTNIIIYNKTFQKGHRGVTDSRGNKMK